MRSKVWDIVDVLTPSDGITDKQVNPKRFKGGVLMASAFVAVGCAAMQGTGAEIPFSEKTSDSVSTVHRSIKPFVRAAARNRVTEGEAEFPAARSGADLANIFGALFAEPDEPFEEPDDSCYF